LVGQISSSLGNLTFLNTLDLANNSFSGPIPLLNKLQNLNKLALWGNHLEGVIPDGITNCSNLVELDLSENNLVGAIPPKIGFLTKLKGILLYNNYLAGVIPPALGKISTLEIVDLSINNLSGSIPNEVWKHIAPQSKFLGQNPQPVVSRTK
jgi:Leucine-rich repeat (LRR) protein